MNRRSSRRGYAMMLVLVFIAMVLSFYSLSYRQLSTALRFETARTLLSQRDEGALRAASEGLSRLETGDPPSDPYVCDIVLETPAGLESYTVTFASDEGAGVIWQVTARPSEAYEDYPDMPELFTPPEEPSEPPGTPPPSPSL